MLCACAGACSRSERPSVDSPSIATSRTRPAAADDTAATRASANERREIALLAGGCFWGMEELLRAQPGVTDTSVGYAGGTVENPTYKAVSSGQSGHAETVRVEFDPSQTSYEALLLFYFTIHDPTTKHRQGNDIGSQYRSAIFVQSDEQRRIAERVKRRVEQSGEWNGPITTEITETRVFYPAEEYHQDYLEKNPGGYTCHYQRDLSF